MYLSVFNEWQYSFTVKMKYFELSDATKAGMYYACVVCLYCYKYIEGKGRKFIAGAGLF